MASRPDAFLQSFLGSFSAVDAAGSRRRQERKLDQRLADEKEFREFRQGIIQSGEDRSQATFEENQRLSEVERRGRSLALREDSTDEELLEVAQAGSASAAEELNRRRVIGRGAAALGLAADQSIIQTGQDIKQAQADADAITESQGPRSLSGGVQAPQIPGDENATRTIPGTELEALRGNAGQGGSAGVQVPAGIQTQAELGAIANLKEAEKIRDAQTATLSDPAIRPAGTSSEEGRTFGETAAINNARINEEWNSFSDINDSAGEQQRDLPPSQLTAKYFQDYNNLSRETKNKTAPQMSPVVAQTMRDQRELIDAPDADPASREVRNASRKYGEALALSGQMITDYRPAELAGVRATGIPAGNVELAEEFGVHVLNAPRSQAPLSTTQLRQIQTQQERLAANPAKKVTPSQLQKIYMGVQAQIYTPKTAIWMASHGGQLPPTVPTTLKLKDDESLYSVNPNNGAFSLIRGSIDAANNNELGDDANAILDKYFTSFNTEDSPGRGQETKGAYVSFLSRTQDLAAANGFDLNDRLDVQALATRWAQVSIFAEQFSNQYWEDGDWDPVFEEHFGSIEEAVYGTEIDRFLIQKNKEFFGFFNEFAEEDVDALATGTIERLRTGLRQANDPVLDAFENQLSDENAAKIIANPELQQLLDENLLKK